MYDTIDRHAGNIYGITHYTQNVAYFVKKYIDFCKYIINYRPICMVKDIIHIISLSWTIDIIPYNQVYGDYFDISRILSGTEKFDFKFLNIFFDLDMKDLHTIKINNNLSLSVMKLL
jgi:hypothetical protein